MTSKCGTGLKKKESQIILITQQFIKKKVDHKKSLISQRSMKWT